MKWCLLTIGSFLAMENRDVAVNYSLLLLSTCESNPENNEEVFMNSYI